MQELQYRPLITDATGRENLAGITNIRCKCERQKVGAQKGGPKVGWLLQRDMQKRVNLRENFKEQWNFLTFNVPSHDIFFKHYLLRPELWISSCSWPRRRGGWPQKRSWRLCPLIFFRILFFNCGPGCLSDVVSWKWVDGTKDKELTGALLFNEQYSTTKYKICVIPTMVFYHYSHPVEGIDFTIAELEVFLKLEVF